MKLLNLIKARVRQGQVRAIHLANAELIRMYWDIGHMVVERQQREGWGAGVLLRLAKDLHNELPEVKGFSERNLKLMTQFYREYSDIWSKGQPPVAQLGQHKITPKGQPPVAQIPWAHNILLIQKVKKRPVREWYVKQTLEQGWSRNILDIMIQNQVHRRQGKTISNFKQKLPANQSDMVQQSLKDPYIFDFLTIEDHFHERELEVGLVRHLEKFLLELGQGFAFVGRQYHVEMGDEDFYIDLLFYHLRLRCYVVIELKKGPFKPEYAGKMNFYCNAVDDLLKHSADHPTIGLILCQNKNKILAEYSLRGVEKPIGVSQYKLTRALPKQLKSSLPTVETIEAELIGKKKP